MHSLGVWRQQLAAAAGWVERFVGSCHSLHTAGLRERLRTRQ
jgi:hypothetical protein